MPRHPGLFFLAGLLNVCLACPPAFGQLPPKSGREWYEESVRHGFRIRSPKDWKFYPDERGNPNILGRYLPKRDASVTQDGGPTFGPTMWLLVFDKAYKEPEVRSERDAQRAAVTSHYETLEAWFKGQDVDLRVKMKVTNVVPIDEDTFKVKGTLGAKSVLYRAVGTQHSSSGATSEGEVYFWTTRYQLSEGKEVAVLFNAPADKREWSKWRTQVRKIAKTFTRVDMEELDTSSVSGSGVRAAKHRALLEMVGANPGWELYATENYFVISNSDDRDFVEEIQLRLEAIREQYEREFPEEQAIAAAQAQAQRRSKQRRAAGAPADGEHGSGDPDEERSSVASASPRELSRCSVVRVCSSREDYMRYGGPAGSAGYWWSATEELVIYDDQAVGGRRNTWATLNHEAFHQFIYYFFANLSPGTWYNEGNADFYSGYKLNKRKKYDLGRFDWRNSTIKAQIREEKNIPLQTLVDITKAEFYGKASVPNPRKGGKAETFSRYPHGWSFMYFLRTGKTHRAKNWNKDWDSILPTYLDTLIATGDPEEANRVAFAGVDWDEMEQCWQEYIVRGK